MSVARAESQYWQGKAQRGSLSRSGQWNGRLEKEGERLRDASRVSGHSRTSHLRSGHSRDRLRMKSPGAAHSPQGL